MDIGMVAKASGVPPSALRFYEEKGLIASIGRQGLRRYYDPSVLERLALIGLGRAAGFSLDEISRVFAADGKPRIERSALVAKADELDRTIQQLQAMSQGLRHAAACSAQTHMECPTFRRLLKAVQRRAASTRDKKSAMPRVKTKRSAG